MWVPSYGGFDCPGDGNEAPPERGVIKDEVISAISACRRHNLVDQPGTSPFSALPTSCGEAPFLGCALSLSCAWDLTKFQDLRVRCYGQYRWAFAD